MDLAQGIDLSGDMPQNVDTSVDVVPAVPNSPDVGLEYNIVPEDQYVDPALVYATDATNNVMPGADAVSSSTGGNPADKSGAPGATSFFSNTFKSFSNLVSTGGQVKGSPTDVARLNSSSTGNVGAQNNVPPVNEQLSTANKALEAATSTYDQFIAWGSQLGLPAPVSKKTVAPAKAVKNNNSQVAYAIAAIVAVFFLAMAFR